MKRFLKSQKGRFSLRQSRSGSRSASKDFVLSMPVTNKGWPDDFGFSLGGSGPSYILSVLEGSSAHMAGLQPGDQVLEIEGQDVSALSPQALAALAQKQKNVPPSIGVVSRVQQLDIPPGPDGHFGFTIMGDCPVLVDDCKLNSPAGRSGLRVGDFVIEVNGIPVKHHETVAAMIKSAHGRTLQLGVLGMGRRVKHTSGGSLKEPGSQGLLKSGLHGSVKGTRPEGLLSSLQASHPNSQHAGHLSSSQEGLSGSLQGILQGSQTNNNQDQSDVMGPVNSQSSDSVRQDRKNKAVEFNKKIEEVLGSEPEVKDKLFAVLKQYAAERNVDMLASALPGILTNEEHRQLLEAIRIFIPRKHRQRFDEVVSQSLVGRIRRGKSLADLDRNRLRRSRSEGYPQRLLVSTRASSVPRTAGESGIAPPARGLRKTTSLMAGHTSAPAHSTIGCRTVRVYKGNKSFGFTLRGHAPVWIDSVIPGSPADKAGLKPGDRILFLNGLDMRTCSHEKVVSMLQGSGAMPTLLVEDGLMGFPPEEMEPPERRGSPLPAQRSPVLTSLQWVAEILPPSIRVNGMTFAQQLEHLLTHSERYAFCRALQAFFQHRNLDNLIVDVFLLLDTPAKQVIWQFIYQLLTYEEQEHCQSKISRFLGYRATAVTAEPEPAPEPQRRSSSMRVTGTTYRSSVKGRSSDDCIIGTHLGKATSVSRRRIHLEPAETGMGMRLTPGERQSGDGTSLPETPNLTNVSAVYAELEGVYAGKRAKSKSLKLRPSPAPDPDPATDSLDPGDLMQPVALQPDTGTEMGRHISGLVMPWEEDLPDPHYQCYPQGEALNPYIGLDSPPPSPPPLGYPASPSFRRKKRFTFSRPPQSLDTDKFLDALSEQLGHHISSVDDFLSPENDYEEMSFQDEDEDEDAVFLSHDLSSPSECHSSNEGGGGGEVSSLTYSSSSEHIPPPPQSPPPPPPFMFNDPPLPLSITPSGPERVPRMHLPYQRRHPHPVPPPPPPRRSSVPHRQSLHRALPTKEELLSRHRQQQSLPPSPVSLPTHSLTHHSHQARQSLPARLSPEPASPGRLLQELHPIGGRQRQSSPELSQPQPHFHHAQEICQAPIIQQIYHARQTQQAEETQRSEQSQQALLRRLSPEPIRQSRLQQMHQAELAQQRHQAQQIQQAFKVQQTQQIQQVHHAQRDEQTHQTQQAKQMQQAQQIQQALKVHQAQQIQQAHQAQQIQPVHQAQQIQQAHQAQQIQQAHQAQQIQQAHQAQQIQQAHQAQQIQQAHQAQQIQQVHQAQQIQQVHKAQQIQQVHQAQQIQQVHHAQRGEQMHQTQQAKQMQQAQQIQQAHQAPQAQQMQQTKQAQQIQPAQQVHQLQQMQPAHQTQQVQQKFHSHLAQKTETQQGLQTQAQKIQPIRPTHHSLQGDSSSEAPHQHHPSGEPTQQGHPLQKIHKAHQIQKVPQVHQSHQKQQTQHSQKTSETDQVHDEINLHDSSPKPTSQGHSLPPTHHSKQSHKDLQAQRKQQALQIHQALQARQVLQTQQMQQAQQKHQVHQVDAGIQTQQTHQRRLSLQPTQQVHPLQQMRQTHCAQQLDQTQKSLQTEPQPSTFSSHQARPSDLSRAANPPTPPPLPPPCEPPPLPGPAQMDSSHMNVKRLRWEQVENSEGTIWGQLGEDSDYDKLNDMVKYLDLELHFGTQKSLKLTVPQLETFKKKDVVEILSHKKAYNTSILIAHLKLSPAELRQVLMSMSAERLEPAHLKQLLLYSPDEDEVKQYQQYSQEPRKLSEPDQFVLQMLSVPEYKIRLRSLLFKTTLQEKLEEMKAGYECIYNASLELETSKRLAKILEFVLAMGNYLNNGQPKTNKTTGFKINFLTELSTTKTVDGKSTFLHILVKSLSQHFPDVLGFSKELTTVPLAAKVNQKTITTDLSDLQSTIQDIRAACQSMPAIPEDRFAVVMKGFLENTHPAMQSLESLQLRAMGEFSKAASFFGEDSKSTATESFFGIFSEFICKFERALNEIQAPEIPRSPRSPRLPSPSPTPW